MRRPRVNVEQRVGENPSAEIRRESAAAKAERIIADELARLDWKGEELARQRKNAPLRARFCLMTILAVFAVLLW